MDRKLWIWIFSILILVTICNCANRHVQTTKCQYYNQTLCEYSHGTYGCGNDTQECAPAENDKPSSCYAFWINKTNELSLKFKVKHSHYL